MIHHYRFTRLDPSAGQNIKDRRSSMLPPGIFAAVIMLFLLPGLPNTVRGQDSKSLPYQDHSHYSAVFGHDKYYRLYIPTGYATSQKRYPVIYFFHGWGGRYFKDDIAITNPEKIHALVDKYQLILVMWDGNIDTADERPYNVGDHEHVKYNVQMRDYFPELVGHIDRTYRTLPDRQRRGIIGFSMGGFMSFYLAGAYPDQIAAAVSMAGSPEFFIGYPASHSLYPVRYLFSNLQDVRIRLHNGDTDILYYLNEEVHQGARWEGVPLDYWKFHGGHVVDKPGEVKVFESAIRFISAAFGKKPAFGTRWSHTDVYAHFSVWNYSINSHKNEPGYVSITNVDKAGFGLHQQKWLPDGPPLNTGAISVVTAPLYQPGEWYHVVRYIKNSGQVQDSAQQADRDGRLSFLYDQPGVETGVYQEQDRASFVAVDHRTGNNSRYLHNGRTGELSLKLFNRGNARLAGGKLQVWLSTTDTAAVLTTGKVEMMVQSGQRVIETPPFSISLHKQTPRHAEPPELNIKVRIQYGKRIFTDKIIVPVLYEAPEMDSIRIDDQRIVRDRSYGKGNGNGIAEAGESIMIYSGSNRLRLYTEDKWALEDECELTEEMLPAIWPDGFSRSSIVKIAPDCPDGHSIRFYGSFETKSFDPIERKTHWGVIEIKVRNQKK